MEPIEGVSATSSADPYTAYYSSSAFATQQDNFSRTSLSNGNQGPEQINQVIQESDPDAVPHIMT